MLVILQVESTKGRCPKAEQQAETQQLQETFKSEVYGSRYSLSNSAVCLGILACCSVLDVSLRGAGASGEGRSASDFYSGRSGERQKRLNNLFLSVTFPIRKQAWKAPK